VLQRNGKLYGAQNALQDSDLNCWNSDQGEQQFFVLKFGRRVRVACVALQFQAGFSSEIIRLYVLSPTSSNDWTEVEELEPNDTLELQTFELEQQVECNDLRLDFEHFKDFYGRITLYRVQVWGYEIEPGHRSAD
jgi:hypothetical protein